MAELRKINYEEFRLIRYEQWINQGMCCAILNQRIGWEDAVLDHKRRTKSEKIGKDGKGLLRGVIHHNVNVFEGKIARLYKRYGLSKLIPLPDLLRHIADYIENPPMKDERIIHPDEREFRKLSKREYNRICKYYFKMYPRRKKLPEYPKSGKLTKEFTMMLRKANELHSRKKNERSNPKGDSKTHC